MESKWEESEMTAAETTSADIHTDLIPVGPRFNRLTSMLQHDLSGEPGIDISGICRLTTANDLRQWVFVVKKTTNTQLMNGDDSIGAKEEEEDTHILNENQPLLLSVNAQPRNGSSHQNANDAMLELTQSQTLDTLDMDFNQCVLHTSKANFDNAANASTQAPTLDFIYAGISENRTRFWCKQLQYQLLLQPETAVEWLLMIDNPLSIATQSPERENRKFNLQFWRDVYVSYYREHISEDIFKFYFKYGYGYDEAYARDQFHTAKDDLLIRHRDVSNVSIFREVDRIRMLKYAFQYTLSPANADINTSTAAADSSASSSRYPSDEMAKRIQDPNHVLVDAFPCHEYHILADIYSRIWGAISITYLPSLFVFPIDAIRDYYGEQIAFSFLFMTQLTKYMIPVASVGVFFQVYQWTSDTVEVELVGLFACLILLWTILVPLLWKQTESVYACKWGQYNNHALDTDNISHSHRDTYSMFSPTTERPDFEGEYRRSTTDGARIKHFGRVHRICKVCASWTLMITVCLALISVYALVLSAEYITYYTHVRVGTLALAIFHGLFVIAMDHFSRWWIPRMNAFENYRTRDEYQRAHTIKKIAFDVINYFAALFMVVVLMHNIFITADDDGDTNIGSDGSAVSGYAHTSSGSALLSWLSCVDTNCLRDLQWHFSTLFLTIVGCNLLIELWRFHCGAFAFRHMHRRVPSSVYFREFSDDERSPTDPYPSLADNDNREHEEHFDDVLQRLPSRKPASTANEYLLCDYRGDVQRPLSEFIVQFGFISGFALYFPWCAPIAVLYNLLIIRLEMHKLVVYCRRPFPYGQCGIVSYANALQYMSCLGVFITCFVFTVNTFELQIIQSARIFPDLIDCAILLLICVLVFVCLRWLFPNIPTAVKTQLKRQVFIAQSIERNYQAMKRYQESLTMDSIRSLSEWSVDEVYAYFSQYGYPRFRLFTKIIQRKQINGRQLCLLSRRELQNVGIRNPYHRIWIEEQIESLKELNRNVRRIYHNRDALGTDTIKDLRYKMNMKANANANSNVMRVGMNTSDADANANRVRSDEEEYGDAGMYSDTDAHMDVEDEKQNQNQNNNSNNNNAYEDESFVVNADHNNVVQPLSLITVAMFECTSDAHFRGDLISMKDIVFGFNQSVDENTRSKLIQGIGSKMKLKMISRVEQIRDILQYLIQLTIKLYYKPNEVRMKDTFSDQAFARDLARIAQWIFAEHMGSQSMNVMEFSRMLNHALLLLTK